MTEGPTEIQISLIWPDVEDLPVLRSNQFLGQLGQGPDGSPEEFVLTLGYVAPPVMLGTPQQQEATFAAMGALSVKALSRVSMSRARLGELIEVLQVSADQYDRGQRGNQQ